MDRDIEKHDQALGATGAMPAGLAASGVGAGLTGGIAGQVINSAFGNGYWARVLGRAPQVSGGPAAAPAGPRLASQGGTYKTPFGTIGVNFDKRMTGGYSFGPNRRVA